MKTSAFIFSAEAKREHVKQLGSWPFLVFLFAEVSEHMTLFTFADNSIRFDLAKEIQHQHVDGVLSLIKVLKCCRRTATKNLDKHVDDIGQKSEPTFHLAAEKCRKKNLSHMMIS